MNVGAPTFITTSFIALNLQHKSYFLETKRQEDSPTHPGLIDVGAPTSATSGLAEEG